MVKDSQILVIDLHQSIMKLGKGDEPHFGHFCHISLPLQLVLVQGPAPGRSPPAAMQLAGTRPASGTEVHFSKNGAFSI